MDLCKGTNVAQGNNFRWICSSLLASVEVGILSERSILKSRYSGLTCNMEKLSTNGGKKRL
jgi:hypothetical protein